MSHAVKKEPHLTGLEFLAGGGEMGRLIRAMDWSETSLGPVESWPQALRSATGILLSSRTQIVMFYGPDLVALYNDAYTPVFGAKHPWALGKPARECWSEIWESTLAPLFGSVFNSGEAFYAQDLPFFIDRHGYTEETYFDVSYDPVRDDKGDVGGILCIVTETTGKVVSARRMRALRDVAARTAEAQTIEDVFFLAAQTLDDYQQDLPFALLYVLEDESGTARLASSTGLVAGTEASPASVSLCAPDGGPWPLAEVTRTAEAVFVRDLAGLFGPFDCGPYPEPPRQALALPITLPGYEKPAPILVAGLSPRLELNDAYRNFCYLIAAAVTTAVTNASALQEERKRAEALAAIDRAKTAFFSNVSHEFRTPLTLILGPLEELLSNTDDDLTAAQRARLETVRRNTNRLQKLVNTLLEFARAEAGRLQASFEPTDLAQLTRELASSFSSAIERSGLTLEINCAPLGEPIYVDRDMWEKIVLNLLSNALKFTFQGGIEISLLDTGEHVVLDVRDTGVGISQRDLPHLFERFYRVQGVSARTHEGSGIGLALVQELVKLQGGRIQVTSTVNVGSKFTVVLPKGVAHLPRERVGAPRTGSTDRRGSAPFVEEALSWLPQSDGRPNTNRAANESGARILLADDNADMRRYVRRVLEPHWQVQAVADGAEALAAARASAPNLIVADIMMPQLDGFELLRELRADVRTATIPVILLSARAGEEASVVGMEAGADDYLVKPFSARELIARVGAHLRMSELRDETLRRERALRAETESILEDLTRARLDAERARREAESAKAAAEAANRAKSDFLAAMSHELRTPLNAIAGYVDLLDMGVHGPLTEAQREALGRVYESEQRLLSLINDVLNFAKIEAGRVEYDMRDVAVADAVSSVSALLTPMIAAKGLIYETDITPDILVRADWDKLQQILLNLLSNAVKFTGPGGRIRLDTPQRTTRDHPEWAFLRISDTGVGIPRSKQEIVFEPFVQVARSLTSSSEGTGLGLSISRDLAHGMGGELRVRSVEGKGSSFTLALRVSSR